MRCSWVLFHWIPLQRDIDEMMSRRERDLQLVVMSMTHSYNKAEEDTCQDGQNTETDDEWTPEKEWTDNKRTNSKGKDCTNHSFENI